MKTVLTIVVVFLLLVGVGSTVYVLGSGIGGLMNNVPDQANSMLNIKVGAVCLVLELVGMASAVAVVIWFWPLLRCRPTEPPAPDDE